MAEMDKSIFRVDWSDVESVDDSGCELWDLLVRFGVEVSGT